MSCQQIMDGGIATILSSVEIPAGNQYSRKMKL